MGLKGRGKERGITDGRRLLPLQTLADGAHLQVASASPRPVHRQWRIRGVGVRVLQISLTHKLCLPIALRIGTLVSLMFTLLFLPKGILLDTMT